MIDAKSAPAELVTTHGNWIYKEELTAGRHLDTSQLTASLSFESPPGRGRMANTSVDLSELGPDRGCAAYGRTIYEACEADVMETCR